MAVRLSFGDDDGGAIGKDLRGAAHDARGYEPGPDYGVRAQRLGALYHALDGFFSGLGEELTVLLDLAACEVTESGHYVATHVPGPHGGAADEAEHFCRFSILDGVSRNDDQFSTSSNLSRFRARRRSVTTPIISVNPCLETLTPERDPGECQG